jgi:serine/threonine protein kinase
MVASDGILMIADFLTCFLEEEKYTEASQVGRQSYSAPETSMGRNLLCKADVFSFGVILYEIVTGKEVFPSTLSPAQIWWKAGNGEASARPELPVEMNETVREIIRRCWVPKPGERPTMKEIWTKLRDVEFRLFQDVQVQFVPFPNAE